MVLQIGQLCLVTFGQSTGGKERLLDLRPDCCGHVSVEGATSTVLYGVLGGYHFKDFQFIL